MYGDSVTSHVSRKFNLCRVAFAACIAATSGFADAQNPGYSLHKVMDSKGSGGLAMTYQIPKGWTAQDNVVWNLSLRLNPMSYSLTAGSPDHQTWISYLSGLTFDFAGFGNRVSAGKAPPARASDFLMQDFEAVHPNMDFDVVSQRDNPIPFPHATVPGVVARAFHSVLTIKFTVNGIPMMENLSEDFYGYSQPTGPGSFRGNWFVSGMTVVNAPEAEISNAEQICNTMLSSEKMSSAFSAKYQKVSKMLLAKTKAEGKAAMQKRARQVIYARSSGGGGGGHAMNKDVFILHEAIRGLRSRIFSWSIGN